MINLCQEELSGFELMTQIIHWVHSTGVLFSLNNVLHCCQNNVNQSTDTFSPVQLTTLNFSKQLIS